MIGSHPDYAGRGVGVKLLRAGMAHAETNNMDVFIEATPVAADWYERNGFQIMERQQIPDGPVRTYMVRPAKPSERLSQITARL